MERRVNKKLTIGSLVMSGALLAAGSASAYNYSLWRRIVTPGNAAQSSHAKVECDEFGGGCWVRGGWFRTVAGQWGHDIMGSPGGNTWLRVRGRCSNGTIQTSAWRAPSSDPQTAKVYSPNCPGYNDAESASQVASDGYSTFSYPTW
jgi:hypothetical protein